MNLKSPVGSLFCAAFYNGNGATYTHLFGPVMTPVRNAAGDYRFTMSRGIDFDNRLIVVINNALLDNGWGSSFVGEVLAPAQPSLFSDTQFRIRTFAFSPTEPTMVLADRAFYVGVFRTEKHANL